MENSKRFEVGGIVIVKEGDVLVYDGGKTGEDSGKVMLAMLKVAKEFKWFETPGVKEFNKNQITLSKISKNKTIYSDKIAKSCFQDLVDTIMFFSTMSEKTFPNMFFINLIDMLVINELDDLDEESKIEIKEPSEESREYMLPIYACTV